MFEAEGSLNYSSMDIVWFYLINNPCLERVFADVELLAKCSLQSGPLRDHSFISILLGLLKVHCKRALMRYK